MIYKKGIALLLICVLCIAIFSSCTNKKENAESTDVEITKTVSKESEVYEENGLPKNEKVTLKIAVFEGGMGREWCDYAMDTFEAKFPNVKFEPIYSPKIGTIIQTKIAANDDADMFDLIMDRGGFSTLELVMNEKVISQEHLWDHELYDTPDKTLKDIALEGIYEMAGRVEGICYVLPMYTQISGLFFDQNLFDEKGWDKAPKTWDEFLELCEKIKESGIAPITFPGIYPAYLDRTFGVKSFEAAEIRGNLDQFMESYRNYEGPQYTSPENIEKWKNISELGKRGYFAEGIAALNHTQSQMQVLQHKAAMVSTGCFVENEMKDSTPEGFKWGFMGVPFSNDPDGTTWLVSGTGTGFYVWSAKPDIHIKWSEEFLVWLWNMDVQVVFAEKAGQLPIRKDFSENLERAAKLQDAPKSIFEYMEKRKIRLENGFRAFTIPDPLVSQASKLYEESVVSMCTGEKDFEPVLQEAEEILQKAIEAYKAK
jgi:N-acetylglucosamine transport system substrate-binding protein